MIKGLEITLGVTGSIAVYKAVYLCRELIKRGANVHTVMTKSAINFVNPLTFQTVTGNPVTFEMFELLTGSEIGHVSLADRAHITVVAPATANIMGKVANGLADDFLSTMIMATKVPVLFAPAMNSVMWESPAMRNNLKRLAESGYHFVEPETGELACGVTGQGKMAEPQQIVESIEAVLTPNALEGLRVLITAGPTVEPIDPVRFISNHSSGKMGYALARAAVRHGAAQVKLISGPTNLPSPVGSDTIQVETAEQMYNATLAHFDEADIIIKTAAVCDWRPSSSAAEKIKKEGNAPPALELEATSDILSELGRRKRDGQLLVGFAAETENIEENARIKLKRKKLDLIVANDVTQPGAGFHSDTNAVKVISTDGKIAGIPLMDKNRVADRIIDALLRYRKRNKA
jgi:phosphopantothenoylcysteine decarboxylase/phosphopantothenate--cysteine ligase